ncbi:MAG: ABC transporter permease [Conexibacter sp.]
MTRYVLTRLATLVFTVLVVSVLIFWMMHSVPGGPFTFDKQLPDYVWQNIRHKYGLDQPIYMQYLHYLGAMLHGDFGVPYQSPTETVLGVIARTWPVTLVLGSITLLISFGGGLLLGTFAALRQNSWADRLITVTSTFGLSVPNFVWAYLLIFVFTLKFGLFPTGGWGSPKQAVMPVIAYALLPMAIVARTTRANVLEVARAPYVEIARARGLPDRVIVRRYVLKNALVPLITVLAPLVPELLVGSIFIESAFAIPGIGRFFTTSALQRDYPMIMATTMMIAVLYGLMVLVSDILVAAIDPRVRLGGSRA